MDDINAEEARRLIAEADGSYEDLWKAAVRKIRSAASNKRDSAVMFSNAKYSEDEWLHLQDDLRVRGFTVSSEALGLAISWAGNEPSSM